MDTNNNNIIDEISTILLDKNASSEQTKQCKIKLQDIINQDPLNFDAWYWLGIYYETETHDFQNAKYCFEKALEIDPNSEKADTVKEVLKICNELLDLKTDEKSAIDFIDNAPDLLEKLPPKVLFISKIIILIATLWFMCPSLLFSYSDQKMLKKTDYYNIREEAFTPDKFDVANQPKPKIGSTEGYQDLIVNSTSSYNYLSKKQIYNLRKNYVKKSLFATNSYEPNKSVFGGIADNKPWWGTNPCSQLNYTGDYHERTEGNSKVSALVNNPNTLVGISMAYSPWEYDYNRDFCKSGAAAFLPTSLRYNAKEKIIVATYRVPGRYTNFRSNVNGQEYGYPLQLSGLNAIDFGYKYVYMVEMKNSEMMYQNGSSVKDEVQMFTDYLHLGGSCRYKDGCNNISPMQSDKMFTIKYLPAVLTLKLWKEKPVNKFAKADFYYKIIIDSED